MTNVGVKVEGAKELRRALKQAATNLEDLKDVNAAVAALVASAAQAAAPRRTGRLASGVRGNRAAGRAVVTFGGARVAYAGPIHFGWPARGIAAQPFVTEAAQATEPTWLRLYEAEIQKIIDRVG